jgi:hypothetical protein
MKSILASLTVALALVAQTQAQTFLTNALVAYYPFDGNANDVSGHGNNGTVEGATLTTDRFGVTNHAYSFDGSNSLIAIPDSIFGPTVQAVTISAWITTDNGPYDSPPQSIFVKGTLNGEMSFGVSSGQITFGPKFQNYGYGYVASAPVRSNSVIHLVGVYQRSQSVSLYVDGVLASSITNVPSDDLWVLPGYPLAAAIGGYDYTPGPYGSFRGSIDDVRIYTRALSASEIQELHSYESSNQSPNLCVPYRAAAHAQVINGFVVGATIIDGGCGYTNPPTVLIVDGGGTGATAMAVVSNGVVANIVITDAGFGYTNPPSIYIYAPMGPQIGLVKAVRPTFSDLSVGTNYQLQVSADLNTWTNQGAPFIATNAVMPYREYWDVANWGGFFRLRIAP